MKLRITTAELDDTGLSSNNTVMQELARQLNLTNPVWQQVCTPALWINVADAPAAGSRSGATEHHPQAINSPQSNTAA